MKRLTTTILMFLITGCLIASCSQKPKYITQTLPSGRVVKIAGVMEIHFSNQSPALMLKYYTDIDLSNRSALQSEAEDIWQSFKVNVDKSGLKSAILSANEMPHGIISETRGFNFVFKKQDNGAWVLNK
jgi:hypothetical protein